MKLGFTLQSTVELDTEIAFESPLVIESYFRVGQSDDPSREQLTSSYSEIQYLGDREHFEKTGEKKFTKKYRDGQPDVDTGEEQES
jgi:hypothetical protein